MATRRQLHLGIPERVLNRRTGRETVIYYSEPAYLVSGGYLPEETFIPPQGFPTLTKARRHAAARRSGMLREDDSE